MKLKQIKLKNDLNTLFINSPGSTCASIQIWFRAGSALETKENQGIAHFLEHMFFKGSINRPGATIASEIESVGGEINAFTSFDYTCYYINAPHHYVEKSVHLLLDMVANPAFSEEELIPERDVVFEEYRRSLDNPNQHLFMKIQKKCFPPGYSHSILGAEQTIKAFSRQQLLDFRQCFYNTSNALLIIAGDLKDTAALHPIIEQYSIPTGNSSNFPAFELAKKATIEIHQKDVKMSQLSLAINASAYTLPQAPAEDLLINCLAHGESSQLFRNIIQENNLANKISCSTLYLAHGAMHLVRISLPIENIQPVLNKIFQTLKHIQCNGLAEWELQKIKNQYVASKVYEKEALDSYAFSLGHGFAQTGNIHCEDEFIEKMKKIGRTVTNQAINELLTRPFHLSVQIPLETSIKPVLAKLEQFQQKLQRLGSIPIRNKKVLDVRFSENDSQVKIINPVKGITLLHRYNPITPTFTLQCYIKGGLTEENAQTNGIYNLLTSCLNKGHDQISFEQLTQELEDKSATLEHISGKNAYGLVLHGLSATTHEIIPLYMGSLLRPNFPNKYLQNEKELVYRALEHIKTDPTKQCFLCAEKLFFNKHPYSQSILGTVKSVKKITRKNLDELHADNLARKEILFSYCGSQTFEEVLELLSPHLSVLKPRAPKKNRFKPYRPISGQEHFIPFDREQTQIFLGIPCDKMGTMEHVYLKMITTHLSGQSSELFVDVRDKKGLCYSTQPVHFAAIEGGYWGIYLASGHDKVKAAIAAIEEIIDKIRDTGLKRHEFDRIKQMIEGQNLLNIQTNEDYANIYSIPLLQGLGVDYFYRQNKLIKELDYFEFQTALKKIFGRKWNTVVVGKSRS